MSDLTQNPLSAQANAMPTQTAAPVAGGAVSSKPYQQLNIPTSQQTLAQQAYESVVDPFRRGFEDRLETSIEGLSRRGMGFGGQKNKTISDLIKSETEAESDIAKSLGAQFGTTLLDQAWQTSEAAQRFKEKKEFLPLQTAADIEKIGAQTSGQIDILGASTGFEKDLMDYQSIIGKDNAQFMADLDYNYQTKLLNFSKNLDKDIQIELAQFMSDLDVNAQKDLLDFSANLNSENQKDLATFMQSLKNGVDPETGEPLTDLQAQEQLIGFQADTTNRINRYLAELENGINPETGNPYTTKELSDIAYANQKDFAEFTSKLDLNAKKDFETFSSNLNASNQIKLAEHLQGLTAGVDPATGRPLTDVQVQQKMTDIQTNAAERLSRYNASLTIGINEETGQPYTQKELNDIAFENEMHLVDRQSEVNQNIARNQAILDRGTNEDGEPLTIAQQSRLIREQDIELDNFASEQAFMDMNEAINGPEGSDLAKETAELRGDALRVDIDLLEKIQEDEEIPPHIKSSVTRLVVDGIGFESKEVQELLVDHAGQDVIESFVEPPDPKSIFENPDREMSNFLKDNGFKMQFANVVTGFGGNIKVPIGFEYNDSIVSKFNELYKKEPEFRKKVRSYL